MKISLFNDSYPPMIDGVANVVVNYATNLRAAGDDVQVVAPEMPDADDSKFAWPVTRFKSFDTRKQIGYVTGNPFSSEAVKAVKEFAPDILHCHCPFSSMILARALRDHVNTPLIMTYHTKYDVDIANAIKGKLLQESALSAILGNIRSADEVWTVSRGAGENLRSLGYEGDYIVMPNGVDVPRMRMTDAEVAATIDCADLPADVPVFLFVGRLMWYKGIRIILDALKGLDSRNIDYRMVFIGGGTDEEEIRAYADNHGLGRKVRFLGSIADRKVISAWYCRADLFLFPSTFDTNGLVVREAAACGLASVLVRDSCAAEGVTDGRNGYLIDENPISMAVLLAQMVEHRNEIRQTGAKASEDLYYSWQDSVHAARERYGEVYDKFLSADHPRKAMPGDGIFKIAGTLMGARKETEE